MKAEIWFQLRVVGVTTSCNLVRRARLIWTTLRGQATYSDIAVNTLG